MLAEVERPSRAVGVLGDYLRREKRIPGFGHLIYRGWDPRARTLLGILRGADMPAERARVNKDECIHCKRCLKVCFYDAMNDTDDATEVNTDSCVGCGGCYSVCPAEGAIDIYPAP